MTDDPPTDAALLPAGLSRLCEADSGIDSLVSPRREEILRLLEKYIAEIELFNGAYSLVGANNRCDIVVRHILDSLAPLGIILRLLEGREARIADVGSGAGLPGIPLAIALPGTQCTLVERMGRRAGFLRNTQAVLGLANVSVEESGMEQAAPGRFSLVTFRAFKPLEPKLLKGLFRLCAAGGALAAYKGRRDVITAEMAALETAMPPRSTDTAQWEAIPCPVPFLDEERHILVIRSDFYGKMVS